MLIAEHQATSLMLCLGLSGIGVGLRCSAAGADASIRLRGSRPGSAAR